MATSEKVSALYLDMQLKTAQFKAAINEASGEMQKFSRQMKEESAKSRESVKLLSEELGMGIPRGLQGIISKLPGVTTAMNSAFDAVVVFALIDTVVKLTDKVEEFIKKDTEAAEKHRETWRTLGSSMDTTVAEIGLANLKLADANAKLEHKPQRNGMKIALEEAILAADKLGDKLIEDTGKIENAIKQERQAGIMGILSRTAGLSGDTTGVSEQARGFKSKLEDIQEDPNLSPTAKTQALHDAADLEHRIAMQRVKDAQGEVDRLELLHKQNDPAGKANNGPAKDVLNAWKDYSATVRPMAPFVAATQQHTTLEGRNAHDTEAHDNAEAGKKALAAATEADRKRLELAKKRLVEIKAANAMSLQAEVDFWKAMAAAPNMSKGARALVGNEVNTSQAELTKHNATENSNDRFSFIKESLEEQRKKIEEAKPESLDSTFEAIQKADTETAAAMKKAARDIYQGASEDIEQKEKLAELIIRLNLVNGRVTASQAAQQIKSIHNTAISATTDAFGTAQNNGAGIGLKEIEKQNGQNNIQQIEDNQAVWTSSFKGSMNDSFNELIQKGNDFNAQFKELLDTTVNSVNNSILKMMTQKDHRGVWKDTGKQVFTSVAKSGLQSAEGNAMKLLGLGKSGKMGTKSNPMYTKSADSIPKLGGGSGSGSGAGGLLGMLNDSDWASSLFGGKLFGSGSFFGGKAGGGLMSPGGFYLTGEQGPELLQVGSTSKISNARDTSSILGGGGTTTNHEWNIDCSNANDPAATRAQVMQGIREAAPSIIAAANGVQREQSKRVPSMNR